MLLIISASWSQIRSASKSSGGVTKNKKSGRRYPRGIKVEDGQGVQRGTILCTQLQLRYYPGENVSLKRAVFTIYMHLNLQKRYLVLL